MVPRSLLRRGENGRPIDAYCVALFAFLDEEQGERGRPWRGRNKMVNATGWPRETVTEHVGHLVARGLVHVEQVGHSMAVYVVANPSRKSTLEAVQRTRAEGGPVDGTPPTQVDGTPPTSGRDTAHPEADCGRHTVHRSRSKRSGSGLVRNGPARDVEVRALVDALPEEVEEAPALALVDEPDAIAGLCRCGQRTGLHDEGAWRCSRCRLDARADPVFDDEPF